MRVIKAPKKVTSKEEDGITVFLAGSIESGEAEKWQQRAEALLADTDVLILNPRRDEWDPTWEQSIGNREFTKQVKWERNGLRIADHIFFYLDPNTKSPITLLELGEFGLGGNVTVVCPHGFYRKGNVEIFCEDNDIELFDTFEEGIEALKMIINEY